MAANKRRSIKREAWWPVSYDETEVGFPGTYTKADIRAIQAVAAGNAGESDQRRAIEWIINHACLTYDEPFRPGQPDVRDYLLGRRSVGLAIVKLIKLKPEAFSGEIFTHSDSEGDL